MKRSKLLPASSLALLLSLLFGSANAQVAVESDATFDVVAENPAVAEELREKEERLEEFFEDDGTLVRPTVTYTPELDARGEKLLLERAEREMGEFDDIDDDDLAELGNTRTESGQPRLEKPGQLEKDAPILDCPAGTTAGLDGCVALVAD